VPGIARGTALTELRVPYGRRIEETIGASLGNADPFVRIGALRAAAGLPADLRLRWGAPLLSDERLAVRTEAARLLSPQRDQIDARSHSAFKSAEEELIAALHANDERPEAHASLASLHADARNFDLAIRELQIALLLDPGATGPRVNFADLYRLLGRENDAETMLREGIELDPASAALHHSLGLLLVRTARRDEGLVELGRAVEIENGNARYLYVYAIALNSLGRADDAITLLTEGKEKFPADYNIHQSLVTVLRDQDRLTEAQQAVEDMLVRYPEIESVRALRESLDQAELQLGDSVPH